MRNHFNGMLINYHNILDLLTIQTKLKALCSFFGSAIAAYAILKRELRYLLSSKTCDVTKNRCILASQQRNQK